MGTVMVLGAGVYQVPLIKKAQELNHDVVVVSPEGDYPGFAFADNVCKLDTTDVEGIVRAARSFEIDAITTTGTDVAVPSIGAVCDDLGLVGMTSEVAHRVTDKSVMKQCFVDGGVETSPFRVVQNLDEASTAADEIGYPVMVKACDTSGSRGITKASTPQELASAYEDAQEVSHLNYCIVEEFIEGVDVGFVAFVSQGELQMCLLHDKFSQDVDGVSISVGHAFPYSGSPEVQRKAESEVQRIVHVMGIDNGAIDGDLRVTPEGEISVIEIAGRCGATCLPELISLSLGVDYYAMIIRNAFGDHVEFPAKNVEVSRAKLMFDEQGGIVTHINSDELDRLRSTYDALIAVDVAIGDRVHAMSNGTDRFGHVVMATDDKNLFEDVFDKAKACITLT